MAKDKFIAPEEYRKVLLEDGIAFSLESPVASISLPGTIRIGFAFHGNFSIYDAQGTIYAIRKGMDIIPMKIDAYSYRTTDVNQKTELVGPIKRFSEFEHHHTSDFPTFMKEWGVDSKF